MSPYIQSIILGIVEGLTEFLPVSSTAHLRIAEALMKIPLDDAYWKMYTIVIQLGAILALCVLFLDRIVELQSRRLRPYVGWPVISDEPCGYSAGCGVPSQNRSGGFQSILGLTAPSSQRDRTPHPHRRDAE